MVNDYNIEFAHIYADKEFGKEQEKSIEILKKITEDLTSRDKTFVTCILIDEFSPKEKTLDEDEFLGEIIERGAKIGFIYYESNLQDNAKKLIKLIDKSRLKVEKFSGKDVIILDSKIGLTDKEGKPTCSLLIATWILGRLGVHKLDLKDSTRKLFEAKKVITILPEKYKTSEAKALEIIKATKFKDQVKNIHYKFF